MNNKYPDEARRAGCCDPGECCPPSSTDGAPGVAAGRGWKTIVFVVVMLLAAGVTARSLLTRRPGRADTSSTSGPADESPLASAPRVLASLEELDGESTDHDFVFVILPGEDEDSLKEIKGPLAEATAKIQATGVGVGTYTLRRGGPGFVKAVDGIGIKQFPAVLALKKGCGGTVIKGDITETKLLLAYLEACGPSSSCCPTTQ